MKRDRGKELAMLMQEVLDIIQYHRLLIRKVIGLINLACILWMNYRLVMISLLLMKKKELQMEGQYHVFLLRKVIHRLMVQLEKQNLQK
jgi:hypothetical protein